MDSIQYPPTLYLSSLGCRGQLLLIYASGLFGFLVWTLLEYLLVKAQNLAIVCLQHSYDFNLVVWGESLRSQILVLLVEILDEG